MTRNLVLHFLGGMAVASVFLGLALAVDGRHGAVAADRPERPGCRVVIGVARADTFATDHPRCRLVA
jgi:hypothetical protein